MIKAVIFDLDDTLCNASEVLEQSLRTTFEENLSHFPGKTVEEMVALNKQAFKDIFLDPSIPVPSASILIWFRIFELMGKKAPIKAIMHLVEKVWEENTTKLKLTPGAYEFLDWLHKNNIKVGVLTNGVFMSQAKKVNMLGIDNKIDCFVTSDMCVADKPDPKAFLYILDKMGVWPSEAIIVGDRIDNDVLGGKRIGMKGVLMKSEHTKRANNEEKADLAVTNLMDIAPFVEDLRDQTQVHYSQS